MKIHYLFLLAAMSASQDDKPSFISQEELLRDMALSFYGLEGYVTFLAIVRNSLEEIDYEDFRVDEIKKSIKEQKKNSEEFKKKNNIPDDEFNKKSLELDSVRENDENYFLFLKEILSINKKFFEFFSDEILKEIEITREIELKGEGGINSRFETPATESQPSEKQKKCLKEFNEFFMSKKDTLIKLFQNHHEKKIKLIDEIIEMIENGSNTGKREIDMEFKDRKQRIENGPKLDESAFEELTMEEVLNHTTFFVEKEEKKKENSEKRLKYFKDILDRGEKLDNYKKVAKTEADNNNPKNKDSKGFNWGVAAIITGLVVIVVLVFYFIIKNKS